MRKNYTTPSANSVIADPPRSVGKITIRKDGNTLDEEFNIEFTLAFEGPVPVLPNPVLCNLVQWDLTPLGLESNYPPQDNHSIQMDHVAGPMPGEYHFVGAILLNTGSGSGSGVMYTAKIEVDSLPLSNRTDVDITNI